MPGMTQDTKIILRELAIIHTTLKVLMAQQEAIAEHVLGAAEPARVPRACTEAQIAETVELMKQRLERHNLFNTDF